MTLAVADTGVGIPAEYLPHVFDRFFRIPGQSDETGTGLGLAIVKEIVAAHKGEVTCESEPGKGTTFRITLPTCDRGGGWRMNTDHSPDRTRNTSWRCSASSSGAG